MYVSRDLSTNARSEESWISNPNCSVSKTGWCS